MLKYKSGTSGECIDLSSRKIKAHVKTAGFYDSGWEVEEIEEKIGCKVGGFRKKAKVFELVLDFIGTKEEREEEANHLFETTEADIINKVIGKLIYNGYEIQCYIIENKYVGKTERTRVVRREVKVYAPYPFWIKKKEYIFKYSDITSTNNKNYPLKYPYRYANGMKIVNVQNDAIDSAHFILRLYGPAVNPMITIAGNPYTVHAVVEAGEYIEINSLEKTVIKKMVTGTEVNLFHYKGKKLFRKILPGQHVVQCGSFDFDLIIFEERSEPRWQSPG